MILLRREDVGALKYAGYAKEVTINGCKVLGIVRSVQQEPGLSWVVTIIPTEPRSSPYDPTGRVTISFRKARLAGDSGRP
jgi:hypothetical protein